MVDIGSNKASEVLGRLLKKIESSTKKESVGEQPTGSSSVVSTSNASLSDKLQQRIEEMRKDKTEEEQKVEFTHEDENYLAGLIISSKDRPNRFSGKTRDINGIYHDVIFNFKGGICKVESDLFIDPFYIVINHNDVKDMQGYVFMVSEFYTMLRILTMFDGRLSLTPVE